MIPYSRMCNVCNACNARFTAVNILRKVSMIQEKLRTRSSAKYKPPGNLIETIANAAVERGSQGGQSNGDSIGSYPVLPTNNTRIAADCCDITISKSRKDAAKRQHRMQRKQRSSEVQAAKCSSMFCSLLPIWSASSGVLFVGC